MENLFNYSMQHIKSRKFTMDAYAEWTSNIDIRSRYKSVDPISNVIPIEIYEEFEDSLFLFNAFYFVRRNKVVSKLISPFIARSHSYLKGIYEKSSSIQTIKEE